jgi:voltage-gated potassium channel
VWEQDEKGRVNHPFEPLVLVATLAMIPVLIVERDAASGSGWATVGRVANWAIWLVFAVEIAFILTVAERKRAALRAHWLDAAIVVVTLPLYPAFLSSLRLLRLVRLMRVARVAVVVSRALQAERRLTSASVFRFVALATILLTVIAGAVEATVDNRDVKSYWDGVWWAVGTVTSVGSGIDPQSVPGRVVAIALMFIGIGFLSVLTATIASTFVKAERATEFDELLEKLGRLEVDIAQVKDAVARVSDRQTQGDITPGPVGAPYAPAED